LLRRAAPRSGVEAHDTAEEMRLMHKAARTWSIFIRRWTGGTSFMVARAALLGSAFLIGMLAA
jgi:hypothetical protein